MAALKMGSFHRAMCRGRGVGGIMSLSIKVNQWKTPIKWMDLDPFSFSNYWKLV